MQYPPINREMYQQYVQELAAHMPKVKPASYEGWAKIRRLARQMRATEATRVKGQ